MKRKITFFGALLLASCLLLAHRAGAQAPNNMTYRVVVRDNNGNPIINRLLGMQISIIQGSSNGTVLYVERQNPTTNANGLVSLDIGLGIVVSGNFSTINWSTGPYYLKTETDPSGGNNYSIIETSQVMRAPYSILAYSGVGNTPGPPGPAGPAGAQGPAGPAGMDGAPGATGAQGPAGPAGAQGPAGPAGMDGAPGATGAQGPAGPAGMDGAPGATGAQGPAGPAGAQGPAGPAGMDGAPGDTGAQGPVGPAGAQGPAGPAGAQGPAGPAGAQGPAGPAGMDGAPGATGAQGPAGPAGMDGAPGATGAQGPAGFLSNGSAAGNTPYWNGSQWVVDISNIYNNGAGIGFGTTTPNASAKVEISSTTQGFLPPRMTTAQRDAIATPALGLVIYNTSTNCLNFYVGNGWSESCGTVIGTISTLTCATATNNGTLTAGLAASGVSSLLPHTGGNGGTHSGQVVASTGVTGLTATLAAGAFANGNGNLTYTISGTPSAAGTASFALNIGGQSCTLSRSVAAGYPAGSVICPTASAIVNVTNPTTGKTWMDRNLGASQVATSSTDINAYGDLYQWGRGSDGHQCRNSAITPFFSNTDQPGHTSFILSPYNPYYWRDPINTNLWQGVSGINNPCPSGYRLPTESELNSERLSWSSNNAAGAFASPLKWPLAGYRANSNGGIYNGGFEGGYWSSSVSGTQIRFLNIVSNFAAIGSSITASGCSVRCLKD